MNTRFYYIFFLRHFITFDVHTKKNDKEEA